MDFRSRSSISCPSSEDPKASPLPQGPVGASQPKQWAGRRSNPDVKPKKCWNCDQTGHMAYDYPKESTGKSNPKSSARMMIRLNLLSLNT